MDPRRVYTTIDIPMNNFLVFARSYLHITEGQIEQVRHAHQYDLQEQKFALIQEWKMLTGREADDMLEGLFEQFCTRTRDPPQNRQQEHSQPDQVDNCSTSQHPNDDRVDRSRDSSPVRHTPDPYFCGEPRPCLNESQPKVLPQNGGGNRIGASEAFGVITELEHQPNEGQSFESNPNQPIRNQRQSLQESSLSSTPPETATHENDEYMSFVKASMHEKSGVEPQNPPRRQSKSIKQSENKKLLDDYFNICNSVPPSVVVEYSPPGKTSSFAENDGCYPVSKKTVKGYIMIFNNMFKKVTGHNERVGSEVDVANLRKLWDEIGDCEVYERSNLTAKDMKEEIRKLVISKHRKSCGFVAFFVMSHGYCDYYASNEPGKENLRKGEDYFLGNDGEKVLISDILKMLENGYPGSTLQGIPKLIFFQICRGGRLHQDFDLLHCRTLTRDGPSQDGSSISMDNIQAATGDVLQGYATHPGYSAIRDESHGSWYINAIVNIFSKHAKDKHILDLMTCVHRAVSKMIGKFGDEYCMQISETITSLSRDLYLFPSQDI